MLTRIDRVQIAVPDAGEAASGWVELLGAEPDATTRVGVLSALCTRLRLGDGWVELLEPAGPGVVADALARWGPHLFGAGVTSPDVAALAARIGARGIEAPMEDGRLYLDAASTGDHGLRLVVGPEETLPTVGEVTSLYEVTNLVEDAASATKHYGALLGLDEAVFVPIASAAYGYAGTLTCFDPDRLDRLEVITPDDPAKTMGRFFAKRGECLYMCFAESASIDAVEARATASGAPTTPVRNEHGTHTLFLHPDALGGVMLGLSRPSQAWLWTGQPERVVQSR